MEAPTLQPSPLDLDLDLDLDTMSSSQHPTEHFLKLEDLQSPSPSSTASPSAFDHDSNDDTMSIMHTSPATVVVQSRPAKKRKSWGQELPEPKTALPPRKRAKTDDEKEQRRIERIKRNRAAAHNSRERKRQETETLAVALARANAELEAYRRLHGPLPASVVLPEVTLSTDSADTPAPSLVESHGTVENSTSPDSPADNIFQLASRVKQEPFDSTLSPLSIPPAFTLDEKSTLASLDPTQHSAAMLWYDLQCQSSAARGQTPPSTCQPHPTAPISTLSPSVNSSCRAWAWIILSLLTLQLTATSKTLLLALWSLSPSRMERWMQASMLRSTSRSTTSSTPATTRTSTSLPLLWRSMALAQHNIAATRHLARRQGAIIALQRMHSSRSTLLSPVVGGGTLTGGDRISEVARLRHGEGEMTARMVEREPAICDGSDDKTADQQKQKNGVQAS